MIVRRATQALQAPPMWPDFHMNMHHSCIDYAPQWSGNQYVLIFISRVKSPIRCLGRMSLHIIAGYPSAVLYWVGTWSKREGRPLATAFALGIGEPCLHPGISNFQPCSAPMQITKAATLFLSSKPIYDTIDLHGKGLTLQ